MLKFQALVCRKCLSFNKVGLNIQLSATRLQEGMGCQEQNCRDQQLRIWVTRIEKKSVVVFVAFFLLFI